MTPRWFRLAARVRGPAMLAGLAGVLVGLLAERLVPDLPTAVTVVLTIGGLAAIIIGLVLAFLPGAPEIPTRTLSSPVTGRWLALNSPTSRVPSHGTHAHGQTFAIDLAYEPEPGSRPAFGRGRAFRPPEDFPAFGQPLLAPADGRVVAVRDTARDHRSRSTWAAFGYLMLESMIRELAGSRYVLGNFVVLDVGRGAYAALVHLRRGSVTVRPGDLVHRGDQLARCGNSGNSTEPHLHFQLMDHRNAFLAAGLPFTFSDVPGGVPGNERAMTAPGRAPS